MITVLSFLFKLADNPHGLQPFDKYLWSFIQPYLLRSIHDSHGHSVIALRFCTSNLLRHTSLVFVVYFTFPEDSSSNVKQIKEKNHSWSLWAMALSFCVTNSICNNSCHLLVNRDCFRGCPLIFIAIQKIDDADQTQKWWYKKGQWVSDFAFWSWLNPIILSLILISLFAWSS